MNLYSFGMLRRSSDADHEQGTTACKASSAAEIYPFLIRGRGEVLKDCCSGLILGPVLRDDCWYTIHNVQGKALHP